MFTYIDPKVRQRLLNQGKLITINPDGHLINFESEEKLELNSISMLGHIPLPLILGDEEYKVDWYACVRHTELKEVQKLADELRQGQQQNSFASLASSMAVNSVLVMGDKSSWTNPLIRVHSSCLTGDVLGSGRCDCGPQLDKSIKEIFSDQEGGMVIYMAGHEGRGIGLWAKAATYLLQDEGENTYQANRSLGLDEDSRDFSEAATLIKYFYGNKSFRLLTNNPKKINDLNKFGLNDISQLKHVIGITDNNRGYLYAKRDWGHKLDEKDISKD